MNTKRRFASTKRNFEEKSICVFPAANSTERLSRETTDFVAHELSTNVSFTGKPPKKKHSLRCGREADTTQVSGESQGLGRRAVEERHKGGASRVESSRVTANSSRVQLAQNTTPVLRASQRASEGARKQPTRCLACQEHRRPTFWSRVRRQPGPNKRIHKRAFARRGNIMAGYRAAASRDIAFFVNTQGHPQDRHILEMHALLTPGVYFER